MHPDVRLPKSIWNRLDREFRFLKDHGFAMVNSDYSSDHPDNWTVEFRSAVGSLHVSSERNFIGLEFSLPGNSSPQQRIAFAEVLDVATSHKARVTPFKGNLFWGRGRQISRLASLMRQNMDAILAYLSRQR